MIVAFFIISNNINIQNKKSIKEEIEKYIAIAHDNGKQVYFAMARIFRHEAIEVYENSIKSSIQRAVLYKKSNNGCDCSSLIHLNQ